MKSTIRKVKTEDVETIFSLYKITASIPGGLARAEDEITLAYVSNFIDLSLARGICLVVESGEDIVGEMHAYWPGIKVFNHVLSELTICIHPDHQGQKLGRKLFLAFMETVENEMLNIKRVELIARESNSKAVTFYQSLGFEIEGCLKNRIDGTLDKLEHDIPMGWLRG
jgi:ribosomal protein S18 acetylase RimI-like enzyme